MVQGLERGGVTAPVPDKPILYRGQGQDRVDALLTAYDYWRRQKVDATGSGGGTVLGRLVRLIRLADREEKLPSQPFNTYPDTLMREVGRIIEALPPNADDGRRIRQTVWEEYCGPAWWTQQQKAARIGITARWYRQLLRYGKILIDRQIDWDGLLVAPPDDEFYLWWLD